MSYPSGIYPKGSLVLHIESYDEDYTLNLFGTATSGHYFVNTDFKQKIKDSPFHPEIDFLPVDFFNFVPGVIFPHLENRFDQNSFCLLNFLQNGDNFFLHRGNMIVSEDALNFLLENNAFKYNIEGRIYGKEFEVLTNCFQVIGDFDDFVLQEMPRKYNYIALKRREIMTEYRQRAGLPPMI